MRERLEVGDPAFGGWCTTGSALAAEMLGHEGFDYVCVDCQHGFLHTESMFSLLQALRGTDATPIVRVPFNETMWSGKALDAGAEAVIVPMVNSGADAERAVAACRYAPGGVRSFGPVRSAMLLGDDPKEVNRAVLCLVMIETMPAVEAADAICATPGVDGIYIGPADLAVSMSGDLSAMSSREHTDAIETVRAACARSGILVGIHTASGRAAQSYAEAGFQMCTVMTDGGMLRTMARQQLAIARAEASSEGATPYR